MEYRAIVWRGLKDSKAWNNLPDEEKEEYETIWNENYHKWKK